MVLIYLHYCVSYFSFVSLEIFILPFSTQKPQKNPQQNNICTSTYKNKNILIKTRQNVAELNQLSWLWDNEYNGSAQWNKKSYCQMPEPQ